MGDMISLVQQAPITGDNFPVKVCLIVVGAAAAIMIVTSIISKRKK